MKKNKLIAKMVWGIALTTSITFAGTSLAATQALFGIDNSTDNLLRISPADASTTVIANLGNRNITGMTAIDNRIMAIDRLSNVLLTIDPLDGSIVSSVELPLLLNTDGLASIDSVLFGFLNGGDQLIIIDTATGNTSFVGSVDVGFVFSLAAIGDTLYTVDVLTGQLVSINPDTAASMAIGPTGTGQVQSMTAIGDTLFVIDVFSDQLIAIDSTTGAGTVVGDIGFGFVAGLATIEVSQVPIPGAAWLFASGLIILARKRGQSWSEWISLGIERFSLKNSL